MKISQSYFYSLTKILIIIVALNLTSCTTLTSTLIIKSDNIFLEIENYESLEFGSASIIDDVIDRLSRNGFSIVLDKSIIESMKERSVSIIRQEWNDCLGINSLSPLVKYMNGNTQTPLWQKSRFIKNLILGKKELNKELPVLTLAVVWSEGPNYMSENGQPMGNTKVPALGLRLEYKGEVEFRAYKAKAPNIGWYGKSDILDEMEYQIGRFVTETICKNELLTNSE